MQHVGITDRQQAHADLFRAEVGRPLGHPTVLAALKEASSASRSCAREVQRSRVGRPRESIWAAFVLALTAKPWEWPWRQIVLVGNALDFDPCSVDPSNPSGIDAAVRRVKALCGRHVTYE